MKKIGESFMKRRMYSLDLLRIIAIAMIIVLHYMNKNIGNGLINDKNFLGLSTHIIESICIIACNIFFLISGYCSIEKKEIKISKIVNLILITLFWGIGIYIFYLVFFGQNINISNLKVAFETVFDRWFIIIYIILYMLVPYINKFINLLSQKQYTTLLFILLFFFSIWTMFLTDVTLLDYGYGIVNSLNLYLIGGYINKYKDNIEDKKKMIIVSGFIALLITTIFSFVAQRAWNYNSIFVIAQFVSVFVIFLNMNIKEHKLIQTISSYSLSIYLIHENTFISQWLYQELCGNIKYIGTWEYVFNLIISTFIIFVVCCILELIRQFLFKKVINPVLEKSKIYNKKYSLE